MEGLILLYSILFAVIPLAHSAPTGPSSSENVTISTPDNTTSHGDPQIICTRSHWTDIATFFLANFFAHVATVKTLPGEPPLKVVLCMLLALVFPTSGVKRGLDAIYCHAIIGGSPLQKARKAGALCEVIRAKDWKPQTGDVVRGVRIKRKVHGENFQPLNSLSEEGRLCRNQNDLELRDLSLNTSNNDTSEQHIVQPQVENPLNVITGVTESTHKDRPASVEVFRVADTSIKKSYRRAIVKRSYGMIGLNGRKVHGLCCLPQGFELSIIVPRSTVLELDEDNIPGEPKTPSTASTSSLSSRSNPSDICSSYSFAKGIVAIFQTLYASATLYRTTGDQIERYGYAAFGLTVAPYLVMSIINLTGAVLTPDYPTLYMVESEIMEEARRRNGAYFGGTVGKVKSEKPVTQSSDVSFEIDDQNRTIIRIHRFDSSCHVINELKNHEEAPEVLSDESPSIIVPQCHDDKADLEDSSIGLLTIVVGLVPVAINGILSHFKAGKSTHAQRVWTMTWLAFGVFIGALVEFKQTGLSYMDEGEIAYNSLQLLYFCCAPAIGGFVVVGQMLMEYGRCIQISGGTF